MRTAACCRALRRHPSTIERLGTACLRPLPLVPQVDKDVGVARLSGRAVAQAPLATQLKQLVAEPLLLADPTVVSTNGGSCGATGRDAERIAPAAGAKSEARDPAPAHADVILVDRLQVTHAGTGGPVKRMGACGWASFRPSLARDNSRRLSLHPWAHPCATVQVGQGTSQLHRPGLRRFLPPSSLNG